MLFYCFTVIILQMIEPMGQKPPEKKPIATRAAGRGKKAEAQITSPGRGRGKKASGGRKGRGGKAAAEVEESGNDSERDISPAGRGHGRGRGRGAGKKGGVGRGKKKDVQETPESTAGDVGSTSMKEGTVDTIVAAELEDVPETPPKKEKGKGKKAPAKKGKQEKTVASDSAQEPTEAEKEDDVTDDPPVTPVKKNLKGKGKKGKVAAAADDIQTEDGPLLQSTPKKGKKVNTWNIQICTKLNAFISLK